jgi:hypothetical protein
MSYLPNGETIKGWLIIGEVDPNNALAAFGAHGSGDILPSPLDNAKGMTFDWNIGGTRKLRCLLIEIAQ